MPAAESFDAVLEQMKAAAGDVIEGTYTQGAVEQLGKVLAIPKKQTSTIFDGLLSTIGQSGYEQGAAYKPCNPDERCNRLRE